MCTTTINVVSRKFRLRLSLPFDSMRAYIHAHTHTHRQTDRQTDRQTERSRARETFVDSPSPNCMRAFNLPGFHIVRTGQ